jgi:uncharacterized membrane protein YphA (DoxX/SURF4 family)
MNEPNPKPPRRFLPAIARILMGLAFLVFGLNGFLNFIPQPKEAMPPGVVALMTGFKASGYMMPLIFGTQTLAGALLLINCFVPLALAFLAPVIVNIIAFHLCLMPSTIAPGIVVLVLEIYLAWSYRRVFAPMLACRVKPDA